MRAIRQEINGKEYLAYGPNRTLLEWLNTSELGQSVLSLASLAEDVLWRALGTQQHAERIQYSKEAVLAFWNAQPGLGPYCFLDTLSEFEFGRVFFPGYRDHVAHQLKVFLLGLYCFDTIDVLKESLLNEIDSADYDDRTSRFLCRWTACSLFHDIGYVLENAPVGNPASNAWNSVVDGFKQVMSTPISTLPATGDLFTSDLEGQLQEDRSIREPRLTVPGDIETAEAFALLKWAGIRSGLGLEAEDSNPVQGYYDYASSHEPLAGGGRPSFRDHGIASALLLLKTWGGFRAYVRKVCDNLDSDTIGDVTSDALETLFSNVENSQACVVAAASAIALHNIDPSIWNSDDAIRAKKLTLKKFRIKLNDDTDTRPVAQMPLAFLLSLVDTLQDWDRPRFRAPQGQADITVIDQDLTIEASPEGQLRLFITKDKRLIDPANDAESCFTKAKDCLRETLQQEAVDTLIECGQPDWWRESPEVVEEPAQVAQRSEYPPPPRPLGYEYFQFEDQIALAREITQCLDDKDGNLVNKYHYLGRHGAAAWQRVENRLGIKRRARGLLKNASTDIVDAAINLIGGECLDIVSLGTGTGQDDTVLLETLSRRFERERIQVFAIDLASELLGVGADAISRHVRSKGMSADVIAVNIDIARLSAATDVLSSRQRHRRLFHLLGLTLGNNREQEFLESISRSMSVGDVLLLGVDFAADNDEVLKATLRDYQNAEAEVDAFLAGPLKTAMRLYPRDNGALWPKGAWRSSGARREYNFVRRGVRIVTQAEDGFGDESDIPGTISFVRYYLPAEVPVPERPDELDLNRAKRCDFSNKYQSEAFERFIVEQQGRLNLKLVAPVREWCQTGQAFVLLQRVEPRGET